MVQRHFYVMGTRFSGCAPFVLESPRLEWSVRYYLLNHLPFTPNWICHPRLLLHLREQVEVRQRLLDADIQSLIESPSHRHANLTGNGDSGGVAPTCPP